MARIFTVWSGEKGPFAAVKAVMDYLNSEKDIASNKERAQDLRRKSIQAAKMALKLRDKAIQLRDEASRVATEMYKKEAPESQPWAIPFDPARCCTHCNGYGSSMKEEQDTCSVCGGSGLKP